LKIGTFGTGTYYANCYMDDLRVYTGVVLTPDQINTIYTNTRINYPIIKNETLKLANPADNDPNIHTIPNLWCKFETGALTTNSGTDVITLVNTGAIPGAWSVRGNNCVYLNGSSQYLSGTITGIANNSFSVSAWLYSTTGAVGNGVVISFGTVATERQGLSLGFGVVNLNKYWFGFYVDDAYSTTAFANDINNWVHITWIYNSNTRERMIYRNGIKLELTGATALGQPNPNNNFRIGQLLNGYWYNGNVDDLRIYTGVVLSQAQITEIYAGNPYYNLPTASTRYNTDPIDTQYQFEVVDEEQKLINRY
jgi:hypothetical protein